MQQGTLEILLPQQIYHSGFSWKAPAVSVQHQPKVKVLHAKYGRLPIIQNHTNVN